MSVRYAVKGGCPACGSDKALVLDVRSGEVLCSSKSCHHPKAITKLLQQTYEIDHIVQIHVDRTFTVQHPIIERVEGTLFDCPVHRDAMALAPSHDHGTWDLIYPGNDFENTPRMQPRRDPLPGEDRPTNDITI